MGLFSNFRRVVLYKTLNTLKQVKKFNKQDSKDFPVPDIPTGFNGFSPSFVKYFFEQGQYELSPETRKRYFETFKAFNYTLQILAQVGNENLAIASEFHNSTKEQNFFSKIRTYTKAFNIMGEEMQARTVPLLTKLHKLFATNNYISNEYTQDLAKQTLYAQNNAGKEENLEIWIGGVGVKQYEKTANEKIEGIMQEIAKRFNETWTKQLPKPVAVYNPALNEFRPKPANYTNFATATGQESNEQRLSKILPAVCDYWNVTETKSIQNEIENYDDMAENEEMAKRFQTGNVNGRLLTIFNIVHGDTFKDDGNLQTLGDSMWKRWKRRRAEKKLAEQEEENKKALTIKR